MAWIQFTQTYSRPTSETRAIKYHYWSDRRLPHLYGFGTHPPVTCKTEKFTTIIIFSS